jgi:hypothetical protein
MHSFSLSHFAKKIDKIYLKIATLRIEIDFKTSNTVTQDITSTDQTCNSLIKIQANEILYQPRNPY